MTSVTSGLVPQKILLDGEWDFTYTQSHTSDIPNEEQFKTKMPVPGYWDDNIHKMQDSDFWSFAKFNPNFRHIDFPLGENPPDASLPFLLGVGWYRKTINVPLDWQGGRAHLSIGGVVLEAWVYVNGNLALHHLGHSTAFDVPISDMLRYGGENEIHIAVANTRTDRLGCEIRGFKGFSAGIKGSVCLKVSGELCINECFLYSASGLKKVNWQIELDGNITRETTLNWLIKDPLTKDIIAKGTLPVSQMHLQWAVDSAGMEPWSDNSPRLYEVEVNITQGENIIDTRIQSFGLRLLERDGCSLRLNGTPVFLRGATEHAYFPLTCTPPRDIETYRKNIRKLKELGFNWLRFHTWVPSEQYMQAADQLGMLIQVEAPLGFEKQEWLDILYACRTHPSVVIYCCGNEELINEPKIEFFREMAKLLKANVPDALFNPQEAMRGIEYRFNETPEEAALAADNVVAEPFPHNPKRLNALREFSDVFGQYPLSLLSYNSVDADRLTFDRRLEIYQRPCLSHEVGIHGNYINLDLEHRYEGTRIGAEIFASLRRNLKKEGLLQKATVYYRNSCAWMKTLRKHAVEMVRKCKYNAGYDFLGAIDHHWHRCGYPCGIMNEFYELKPGESREDVLEYNGESLLLLDNTNNRNLKCGDTISFDLYSSLFGGHDMKEGCLRWYWADENHQILQRSEAKVLDVHSGRPEKLARISFHAPQLTNPVKVTLYTHLSGGAYEIKNRWDYWIFPDPVLYARHVSADTSIANHYNGIFSETVSDKDSGIRVVSELTEDTIKYLVRGGRAVLIGSKPFPTLPTTFQLSTAGRPLWNLSTVIEDHPLMNRFPHNGFCDWQFFNMFEGGEAVLFNQLNIPFSPVIEVVSSFKLIRKQANLFEVNVGRGKLLVCTLNLNTSDAGANYLLKTMINYADGSEFNPCINMSVNEIKRLMGIELKTDNDFENDEAADYNVQ